MYNKIAFCYNKQELVKYHLCQNLERQILLLQKPHN